MLIVCERRNEKNDGARKMFPHSSSRIEDDRA
jgi:hypothetical protein